MRLGPTKPCPKPIARNKKDEKDGDEEFYAMIWATRPHFCSNSGLPLPEYNPNDKDFTFKIREHIHHVLPKHKDEYAKFRHEPRNVILLSWDAHQKLEHSDTRVYRSMPVWEKCKAIMVELIGEVPNDWKFENKEDKIARI